MPVATATPLHRQYVTPNKQAFVYHRPFVYPKQLEAIFEPKDFLGNPARYSFIEASTKTGKTIGCVCWLFEQAYQAKRPNQEYWWVAPTFVQAAIAFRRMKGAVPAQLVEKFHEGELYCKLRNGSIIRFKTGENPDTLYGEDVWAAVLDEASRMREGAWHAVRSTLTATEGPIRVIGNVKGRKNWIYALCRRAQAGMARMAYYKIIAADAVDARVLSAEEVEDAKAALPEAVFKELYMAEASDDQGNPFGIREIAACVAELSTLDPVCWGWDLAKKQDWTVGIALDQNGAVCRIERFQCPWPETIRRIRIATDGNPALVDSTGVGDPVLDHLQLEAGGNFEGYFYTMPSKQKIMEGLAVAIQSHTTTVIEGVHRSELESFEYEYSRLGVRYTAPEGAHDDTVCAHAQAYHHYTMTSSLANWVKLGQ